MFVFISDIFECRIECKNSNDFSIGLWKGLVIFLFENTSVVCEVDNAIP